MHSSPLRLASMFRPRTIDSEPALYDAAVKILMRRAHSVSDMKKALIRPKKSSPASNKTA